MQRFRPGGCRRRPCHAIREVRGPYVVSLVQRHKSDSLSIGHFGISLWIDASENTTIDLFCCSLMTTREDARRLAAQVVRHGSCPHSDRGFGAGAGRSSPVGVLLLPRQALERRLLPLPLTARCRSTSFIIAVSDPISGLCTLTYPTKKPPL